MKPQFKPEEIYLDLSKLSEDKRKEVRRLLFKKPHYEKLFFLPDYEDKPFLICLYGKWDLEVNKRREYTELTYSQFLDMMGESEEKSKVIENSEKELSTEGQRCPLVKNRNNTMETLYRKVAASEEPKHNGNYHCIFPEGQIFTILFLKEYGFHEEFTDCSGITHYLEEIPDPTIQLQADKDELLEALKKIYRIGHKPYRNTRNEEIEINRIAESLIQKHKQ